MTRETSLSAREMEVATLYAGGATYHTIAVQLFIAPATVRSHLAAIYRKLKLSSKLELKTRLDGDTNPSKPQVDQDAIISELALRLEEGVSREKALSAVLRIISRSDGDLDAVIPSILEYAVELCDADSGILMEYRPNGQFCAKYSKGIPQKFQQWLDEANEFTANRHTGLGRLATHKAAVNIIDVQSEKLYQGADPLRYATAVLGEVRSLLAIPMLAGDELVGAFTLFRQHVQPFTEDVTRLASIFADQSVIAIKNAQMIGALRKVNHAASLVLK